MADSPFAPFANAVLRFQVASGSLTLDRNGNPRPGKAIVEVSALLEQKRDPNRKEQPGIDPQSIWIEGYLVSPAVMPTIVTPDSPAQAVWQGRSGRFYAEFTARNPYLAALEINLVEKVRGYFLPGSFVVSGDVWTPAANTSNFAANITAIATSTNSTAIALSPNPSDALVIPANTSVNFTIDAIARHKTQSYSAAWFFQGVIKRSGSLGSVVIPDPLTKTVTARDPQAKDWDIAISANTTTGALQLTANPAGVTGEVDWVASIRMVSTSDQLIQAASGGAIVSSDKYLMSDAYTAASALSAYRIVKREGSQIQYASSAVTGDAFKILGLLISPIASGSSGAAVVEGFLSNEAWNWTTGDPIFLGTDGTLTQTAPSSGFICQVATPIAPTEISLDIQPPIFL